MKTMENYRKLINIIASSLQARGFVKHGYRFYLEAEESWGIIDFQKSTKSTSEYIVFTVNLGVASKRLLKYFSTIREGSKPDLWDCHWQVRLGHLLEANKDLWWTVDSRTAIDQLGQQIDEYILNSGIPELLRYLKDESLRDLWLSNRSPALTEIQRLKYLLVLLKEIGPQSSLDAVQAEFKRHTGYDLP